MKYELIENSLSAKDFIAMRESAGWGCPLEHQVEAGLKNSIYIVSAVHNERVIGMGRLVGDGVTICYVQDVIVLPQYQGQGIGKAIMERLIAYVKDNGFENTNITIGLFSAKGIEEFYRKLGFYERPNENRGAGMEMIIKV